MRAAPTIAATALLLVCAAARGEPLTLTPRTTCATRFPLPGEPPRHSSKVTVDAVEWRPGERRGKVLVKVTFSAPAAGPGAQAPRDGWLRAVDDAGLVHLLSPLRSLDALEAGADFSLVFQADIPGSPGVLKLLVGPPLKPDGGVRLDLSKKTAVAFKPGREPPAISWPALEQTASRFLPPPGPAPAFSPRLTVPLAGAVAALHRDCLKNVDLLLPAAQLVPAQEGQGARLAVVRVFVNRGSEAGCEVPKEIFYADDVGSLVPSDQAYLVAAPAFASYLDVVEVDLPAHAERGHLFVSGTAGQTRPEIVAQLRVDLTQRTLTLVEDVEGLLVDENDGKPLPNVELWLRGAPDWRSDRELVRQVRSGPDGRFRFERIEPGRYAVSGRVAEGREVRQEFVQGSGKTKLKLELEGDRPAPGFIGVMLQEKNGGLFIEEVMRRSNAARAGLKPGDRIVAVDSRQVATLLEAHARIPGDPGTEVRLEIERDGGRFKVDVVRTPERARRRR